MKRIKLLLALLILATVSVTAQTNVSGGIYANTTWTLANSPYIMTGSIVVFPGVVLTIEPGVEVRVKESIPPALSYYFESRGTVNMIGQPGALITFKSDSTPDKVGSWNGFYVINSQGGTINYDYVNISNAISTFTYDGAVPGYIGLHQSEFYYNGNAINVGFQLKADSCIFKGNITTVTGWSNFEFNHCMFDSNSIAMFIYASDLKIDSCTFINNNAAISLNSAATVGLSIKHSTFSNNNSAIYGPNNGVIEDCKFFNNGDALNMTYYMLIKNCILENNGIAILASVATTVSDCEINFNDVGVAIAGVSFSQPKPIIENNRICSNNNYNIDNQTNLNLFIPTNCFCESDSSVIESKILDGYDDITKGLISYAIFDTTCTNVLKIVNKTPGVTAIAENDKSVIKVFPNPATDNLNIINDGAISSLEIYNMTGQLQLKATISAGTNMVDISNLKAALYYAKFTDDTYNTKTLRFSKL